MYIKHGNERRSTEAHTNTFYIEADISAIFMTEMKKKV